MTLHDKAIQVSCLWAHSTCHAPALQKHALTSTERLQHVICDGRVHVHCRYDCALLNV